MAVSAATQWEIRQTATAGNVNGGGFVTGASGTDYSQQDAAQYNLTSVTSSGAGNTVLHASAASDMVGNIARCVSGTNANTGWYEITSVVAGVSITFGTNAAGQSIASGIMANGVINIGGALSMGSTLDDDVMEAAAPGNTFWMKYSATAYTLGESIAISLAGTAASPINWKGYNTTRGDNPTGANMPQINLSTNRTITLGTQWNAMYFGWYGSANAGLMNAGAGSKIIGARGYTTGATSPAALQIGAAAGVTVLGGEFIAPRGSGILLSSASSDSAKVIGNFIHDSVNGVSLGNAGVASFIAQNNIFANNSGNDINLTAGVTDPMLINSNTFYGSEAKMGTAITFATGAVGAIVTNNIVYGKATGVVHADNQTSGYDDYNDYYNNTNDVSSTAQWQKGANSIAVDPDFTNASQITGTAAVTLSSNRIQDSSKNFTSLGVVATTPPTYFVNILSGTGVTPQIAGVTAITTVTNPNDTLTLDITTTANATADKAYSIPIGNNFLPTGAI